MSQQQNQTQTEVKKAQQLQLSQRMGIFDRCLSDLQFCVTDWNLEIILGIIFSVEMGDGGVIQHAYRNFPRTTCGTI